MRSESREIYCSNCEPVYSRLVRDVRDCYSDDCHGTLELPHYSLEMHVGVHILDCTLGQLLTCTSACSLQSDIRLVLPSICLLSFRGQYCGMQLPCCLALPNCPVSLLLSCSMECKESFHFQLTEKLQYRFLATTAVAKARARRQTM